MIFLTNRRPFPSFLSSISPVKRIIFTFHSSKLTIRAFAGHPGSFLYVKKAHPSERRSVRRMRFSFIRNHQSESGRFLSGGAMRRKSRLRYIVPTAGLFIYRRKAGVERLIRISALADSHNAVAIGFQILQRHADQIEQLVFAGNHVLH